MKTSPVPKPPETDEQKLDAASRTMTITSSTPAPTTKTDPWSIEAQAQRDIAIVSTILARHCQHRDLIELRGNRTVGLGELCDAMLDRADLCCLFSSEQRAERARLRLRSR